MIREELRIAPNQTDGTILKCVAYHFRRNLPEGSCSVKRSPHVAREGGGGVARAGGSGFGRPLGVRQVAAGLGRGLLVGPRRDGGRVKRSPHVAREGGAGPVSGVGGGSALVRWQPSAGHA